MNLKTHTKMSTKKTTLSFTAEELEVIYSALNNYALEQMQTSKTWGNIDKFVEHKGHDVWGREAAIAARLQSRTYLAQTRLEKNA